MLNPTIHRNEAGFVRALYFPGSPVGKPVIWFLLLVSVIDFLFEQTVLVVDAITESRHTQGRQGVQKTGSQATEPAIAEGRITLAFLHLFQLNPHLEKRFPAEIKNTEIIQVVSQGPPHEKFYGKII